MLCGAPTFAQKGTLELKVTGLRNTQGEILVAMFNQAEGFPRDESRFFRADTIRNLNGTVAQTSFKDLAYGEYAITLMHDENVDGVMEFNLIGMPTEGYGFSRNYHPKLRAPKFKETSFQFKKNGQMVNIELIY